MPFGTHRLAIGIVIELDEFQSPPNEHRVERGENKSNRNPKTLRSCFRRAERRFLTSQILPPKRSSRRPRQELADYLLTPCVQPSLRRLSSTYSQSSAKFNCRFASRPICHVRAGSALPSIEDLDERSRGNATSSPRLRRARGCWRSSRRGRPCPFLPMRAAYGRSNSGRTGERRALTERTPGLSGSVQAGAGISIGRTHETGRVAPLRWR